MKISGRPRAGSTGRSLIGMTPGAADQRPFGGGPPGSSPTGCGCGLTKRRARGDSPASSRGRGRAPPPGCRRGDRLAAVEHRDQQVLGVVERAGLDRGREAGVVDVVQLGPVAGRQPGVLVVDDVRDQRVAQPQPAHLQDARVGDLDRLLAELELVLPGAVVAAHRAELVDAAQRGLLAAGDQLGADAPGVDARALLEQAGDHGLVEIVRRDDARLGEAGVVEQAPRLDRQVGEVAGVEADAGEVVAVGAQRAAHLDRVAHAVEGVVGVDQEDAVVGHRAGVGLERGALAVVEHHPRVRVGALDGDAVELAGQHVRGGRAAADVRGARRRQPAVEALGAAQAELEHRLSPGGVADPGRLAGDQGLEVDDGQQRGLDQLGLQDRALHAQQGLVREDHGALGHGVDPTRKAHRAQVREEGRLEQRLAVAAGDRRQVRQVGGVEAQPLEELDRRLDATRDRVRAAERVAPEGQVEDRLALGLAGLPVAVGHGQLVQVREQRQRRAVEFSEPAGGHVLPIRCIV